VALGLLGLTRHRCLCGAAFAGAHSPPLSMRRCVRWRSLATVADAALRSLALTRHRC